MIGFAGNLYARDSWQAFLNALSSINWQLADRKITVWLIGRREPRDRKDKALVKYFIWRSLKKTIDLLAKTDITYLPYWFDKKHSFFARVCFPNKLSVYLAAGKPVFFHGIKDSSPACFFRQYPVGPCCHSLEKSEIIKSLRRFITDKKLYSSAVRAGQKALDEELNLSVFLGRFAKLVGIKENQLQ